MCMACISDPAGLDYGIGLKVICRQGTGVFVGTFALMHGSERRAWNRFADKLDLLDNRLIAVQKTGLHFTHQATHGDRFDQSHIDKSYCGDMGRWMEFVREMIHDATQTLLDHHPTLVCIALFPTPSSRKKTSYMKLKLNADELGVESMWVKLKQIWKEQMLEGRDLWVNQEFGWKAIKKC